MAADFLLDHGLHALSGSVDFWRGAARASATARALLTTLAAVLVGAWSSLWPWSAVLLAGWLVLGAGLGLFAEWRGRRGHSDDGKVVPFRRR